MDQRRDGDISIIKEVFTRRSLVLDTDLPNPKADLKPLFIKLFEFFFIKIPTFKTKLFGTGEKYFAKELS